MPLTRREALVGARGGLLWLTAPASTEPAAYPVRDRLADRTILIDEGRIVRAGPTVEVLGDPALADHGVEPPPRARIRAAIAAAGLDDTGVTDALLLELAS